MARHNRARSSKDLRRKSPKRPPFDRVLIVCEGSKTEVNYFEEIRQEVRISPVYIHVVHSKLGTEPQLIVEAAEAEFDETKAYEKVYAVFDRDEHKTYANAIVMAEARNEKLKNDEKKNVMFEAVVSVPSFELWLLLHFENIQAWLHRREAFKRLKVHIPGYEKGKKGTYAATSEFLETAILRGKALQVRFERVPGQDAYTDVHDLVETLRNLRT